jgi:hypothetical protein
MNSDYTVNPKVCLKLLTVAATISAVYRWYKQKRSSVADRILALHINLTAEEYTVFTFIL